MKGKILDLRIVAPAAVFLMALSIFFSSSCSQESGGESENNKDKNQSPSANTLEPKEGELLRVGNIVIYQSDLDYHLEENHSGRSDKETRKKALDQLVERARFSQAALDADLDKDPLVRAEVARLLSSRLKETSLAAKLKAADTPVPEERLRELYAAQPERFASGEKRRFAVLWLDPGPDPDRLQKYQEKLSQGREWFFKSSDLAQSPEKGFSVLSIDHSEHPASRFKGGDVGWLEREGGGTDWSRAVAEIGFALGKTGEISPVITRPEGVFLVRLMATTVAVQRPFESVRTQLEKEEKRRRRIEVEAEFKREMEARYPVP